MCMHCGVCVGICPLNVVTLLETAIIFGEKCTQCGICERGCPVGAIYE